MKALALSAYHALQLEAETLRQQIAAIDARLAEIFAEVDRQRAAENEGEEWKNL